MKSQLIGRFQTWWLKASLLQLLALRVLWPLAQVLQGVEDGVELLQGLLVRPLHGGRGLREGGRVGWASEYVVNPAARTWGLALHLDKSTCLPLFCPPTSPPLLLTL